MPPVWVTEGGLYGGNGRRSVHACAAEIGEQALADALSERTLRLVPGRIEPEHNRLVEVRERGDIAGSELESHPAREPDDAVAGGGGQERTGNGAVATAQVNDAV